MANYSPVAAVGDLGVELQVDIDLLQSQSPLTFLKSTPVVRYTRLICRERAETGLAYIEAVFELTSAPR